jgi:mRNA interferase RelE/StbE
LSEPARCFFEDAPAQLQRRLDRCFTQISASPRRHSNIRALKGTLTGYYRYRLGDYRIVYSVNDDRRIVVVALIATRGSVYD